MTVTIPSQTERRHRFRFTAESRETMDRKRGQHGSSKENGNEKTLIFETASLNICDTLRGEFVAVWEKIN